MNGLATDLSQLLDEVLLLLRVLPNGSNDGARRGGRQDSRRFLHGMVGICVGETRRTTWTLSRVVLMCWCLYDANAQTVRKHLAGALTTSKLGQAERRSIASAA